MQSKPITPKMAAKSMVLKAEELGLTMTNLKLQKLLYFAHGVSLGANSQPLIETEPFQAWKYGPVIESLYHSLKPFGSSPISSDLDAVAEWDQIVDSGNQKYLDVIDSVLCQFGRKSARFLVNFSHASDGPWHSVFNDAHRSIEIPDDEIKAYFAKLLAA